MRGTAPKGLIAKNRNESILRGVRFNAGRRRFASRWRRFPAKFFRKGERAAILESTDAPKQWDAVQFSSRIGQDSRSPNDLINRFQMLTNCSLPMCLFPLCLIGRTLRFESSILKVRPGGMDGLSSRFSVPARLSNAT